MIPAIIIPGEGKTDKRYVLSNIRWDVDRPSHERGLPKKVTVLCDEAFDPMMEGADALSDHYGFCVLGFTVEPLPVPDEVCCG